MERKIAIAGLGAAAKNIHLPAYRKLDELRVVGGYDPSIGKSEFEFPVFESLSEMLERAEPDILTVASPPSSHFELTKAGLLSGCHVFCEKPFMPNLAQAAEIIELSKKMNRWVVVNSQFKFMNVHMSAREMIGKPEFGKLLFVTMHQTFFVTEETEAGWRGEDRQRTCKDFGPHALDLSRYFFGEDPKSVSARMPKVGDTEGPDYLNLIQLEFSGDRVCHIILDRLSRGRHRYLDIRLDGSDGCIETRLGGGIEFSAGIRGRTRKPFVALDVSMGGRARLYHGESYRTLASDPLDLFPHATARLLGEFLTALDRGTTPPCHAEDNSRTLALMLAAYESSDCNAPILIRN